MTRHVRPKATGSSNPPAPSSDPDASVAAVQVNEAPCPADSAGHVHPAGTVIDCQSSVLFRITFICAFVAVAGPAFVT